MTVLDPEGFEPAVRFSLARVRRVPRRDLAVRFAFGAGVSTVASIVAIGFGMRAGGLMLAFPAILPATLTLLAHEESERKAADDDLGSMLGAVGLAAFAALASALLPATGAPLALVMACVAWFGVSIGCYAAIRSLAVRAGRRRDGPRGRQRGEVVRPG